MSSIVDNEIAASPVAWLHGVWESESAVVSYPTMETINYYEVMEFTPLSPILVDYKSQTWHAENKTKMHTEKGFLKVNSETGTIAFVVAHNFGLTELAEGSVSEQKLHLDARYLSWISFTKLTATKQVIRDFVLKDDVLYQTVFMETTETPLTLHLECKYRKMKG